MINIKKTFKIILLAGGIFYSTHTNAAIRCFISDTSPHRMRSTTTFLCSSPSDKSIIAQVNDGKIQVSSLTIGLCREFVCEQSPALSANFSDNGAKIVSTHKDGNIRVWDVKNNKLFHEYVCESPANSASLNPDGTKVISSHIDGKIRLWNTKTNICHTLGEGYNPQFTIHECEIVAMYEHNKFVFYRDEYFSNLTGTTKAQARPWEDVFYLAK